MGTTDVSFSAQDVKALRDKTGLPMMQCKKALTESGGDPAAAESWLREHLKGKMDTRTERATAEGRIAVLIEGAKATIVEVQTETDFTAKNEAFGAMMDVVAREAIAQPAGPVAVTDVMTKPIDDLRISTGENVNFSRGEVLEGGTFGQYVHHDGKRACLLQVQGSADAASLKGICQHIVFHNPLGISETDVDPAVLEEIRATALSEAKASGKNDEIAGKIAEGKVRRYLEDNTLLHQKYVLDETMQVRSILPAGTTITRFVRYTLGG